MGQHFLKDDIVAQKIVDALALGGQETVVEIGPGLGVLSRHLVAAARHVIAVEIDPKLSDTLSEQLGQFPHFHLLRRDILEADLRQIRLQYSSERLKVVGNLPYAITTPILFFLLQYKSEIEQVVVTVQREVAQRILSPPGGKEYGALSVAVQYHSVPERILEIPASAFYPRPKVDSTVLRLRILERPSVSVKDEGLFFRVVRSAFGQRRKMLRNALSAAFGLSADELEGISIHSGIDLRRRGETLSLAEFGRLSDALWRLKRQKP